MPTDERLTTTLMRQASTISLAWTGRFVPQIGQRVRVTSEGGRPGRVEGFFAAQRQLGVRIKLETPPAPWSREASDRSNVLAFGHDIEPEADQ